MNPIIYFFTIRIETLRWSVFNTAATLGTKFLKHSETIKKRSSVEQQPLTYRILHLLVTWLSFLQVISFAVPFLTCIWFSTSLIHPRRWFRMRIRAWSMVSSVVDVAYSFIVFYDWSTSLFSWKSFVDFSPRFTLKSQETEYRFSNVQTNSTLQSELITL